VNQPDISLSIYERSFVHDHNQAKEKLKAAAASSK